MLMRTPSSVKRETSSGKREPAEPPTPGLALGAADRVPFFPLGWRDGSGLEMARAGATRAPVLLRVEMPMTEVRSFAGGSFGSGGGGDRDDEAGGEAWRRMRL